LKNGFVREFRGIREKREKGGEKEVVPNDERARRRKGQQTFGGTGVRP